jgi:hypothetical protein
VWGREITEIVTLTKEKDQGLESVTVEGQDGNVEEEYGEGRA